jgi:hypothetical protein
VADLSEDSCKDLNSLIVVELLVEYAEVFIVCNWLPALILVASVDVALLRLVLSEVQALLREHLAANGDLEVLVRYDSILVQVKLVKDMIKLHLVDVNAPKCKVKLQLPLADLS